MTRWLAVLAVLLPLFVAGTALALDEEELNRRAQSWAWHEGPGEFAVQSGNAEVSVSAGQAILTDPADIREYLALSGNKDAKLPPTALVFAENYFINYIYNDVGYVELSSWEDLDADGLMDHFRSQAEKLSRKPGHEQIAVDGWISRPVLDREQAVVSWAIDLRVSGQKVVLAQALKLGRRGYVIVAWGGAPQFYTGTEEVLAPALAAWHFNEGATYADYVPGVDTVAKVGIAALVGKMIAGKAGIKVGAGLLAALLLGLKKFGVLIVIPLGALWRWLRGGRLRENKEKSVVTEHNAAPEPKMPAREGREVPEAVKVEEPEEEPVPLQVADLRPPEIRDLAAEGRVAFKAGKFEQAESLFAQAIEAEPEKGGLYWQRAAARHRLGRTEETLADLRRAVALGHEKAGEMLKKLMDS